MNREDLLSLCECFVDRRGGVAAGRIVIDARELMVDPVPEILRSFRRAEISESEKNALMSLVCDPDEDPEFAAETACVQDPYADEQATAADDD